MDVTKTLNDVKTWRSLMLSEMDARIPLLTRYADKLKGLDLPSARLEVYENRIDFNRLTHSEVMLLISFFGGKWEKELNKDRIDYSTVLEDGTTIRAWAGEPPPSCKIIEVVEDVPATTRIVRKLQCD